MRIDQQIIVIRHIVQRGDDPKDDIEIRNDVLLAPSEDMIKRAARFLVEDMEIAGDMWSMGVAMEPKEFARVFLTAALWGGEDAS